MNSGQKLPIFANIDLMERNCNLVKNVLLNVYFIRSTGINFLLGERWLNFENNIYQGFN